MILAGRKPVIEAIKSGKRPDKILLLKTATGDEITAIRQMANAVGVPVQSVPREKLESILHKYVRNRDFNHQGVVAIMPWITYQKTEDVVYQALSKGENPLLLILDHITDVRNFGAIARSAACLGAHALIIPSAGAAQINAEAMKTSAGALNHIYVCREKSLLTTVKYLKAAGVRVYATHPQGKPAALAEWKVPVAVILGNEGKGISPELVKAADDVIGIPIQSATGSLNVSVSAGIILYEAMRQRI